MYQFFCFLWIGFGLITSLTQPEGKIPTYELQAALDQNLIRLSEIAYTSDNLLHLSLENLHKKKDLNIVIKSGLQFASQNTREQDQILIAERTLQVKAGSKRSVDLKTYCTQSAHLSPGSGSTFALKTYADGQLMKLAQFLSKTRDAEEIAQQAVWIITNNHDLRGLYHPDTKKAAAIQNFIADLTGKARPIYTVRYRSGEAGQQAFVPEVVSIHGQHEYDLEVPGVFTCKIFSEIGEEVKEVFKDMQQGRGHVRFSFELQTTRLPKGKYVSRVFKGDQLFQEIWLES